jgi:valyl-tRNA synthetase
VSMRADVETATVRTPSPDLVEAGRTDLVDAGRIRSLTVEPGAEVTVDVVLAETPAD